MTNQEICDYLNDLMERDPQAMNVLLTTKTPCNDALVDAPDTPCWPDAITPLGVLCGLSGYDESRQRTRIVAHYDGTALTHFYVADDDTPELIERPEDGA